MSSKRVRRVWTGSTGIFVITLAAFAGLASGQEQTSKAPAETSPAASPSPRATVDADRSLAPAVIDPPAPPGATSPAVATENVTTLKRGHDVLMTWLEPGESGGRLKFARHTGQAWSRPITITDQVSTLDPMDRPSLTVLDTQAVRRTLIARTGDVVARSGNAGRTWTRLPTPALPFASFAGGQEGGYAFWLDPGGDDSAKLLGARILTGDAVIDPHVAADSGTSAAMTWDGPVVVYRDHSAAGSQDIAMVRRENGQWTRPRPVHHVAGWRSAGKLKSGPEVAALRRQVAVAWYTEAPHRPRVLVAFSSDAARTFDAPIEVDVKEGHRAPLAYVDVALDDNGDALVLWMVATGPTEATLNLARVSPDGQRGQKLVIAEKLPRRGTNGGSPRRGTNEGEVPQIVLAGDHAAVTWIEGDPGRVRVMSVPLAGISPSGGVHSSPAIASETTPKADSGQGRVGELGPDVELVSLNGDKVSLPSLRGRAVLLNLWATWCLPCIAEMPELVELYDAYDGKELAMVGLSVDGADATDKVRAFVSKHEIPFAVWLDPEMRVYKALRVKSLPVTLILDREGRIVMRRDGTIKADDPDLRRALSRALSDS